MSPGAWPSPPGLSGGGDREEGGRSPGPLELLGAPLRGLAGASRPWRTLARGAAPRPIRREPSPGLQLHSPLSTSLPFLAIAVFPMTRETASRGDGGEGTGAVPPPRSLQQLPPLLGSHRPWSTAAGCAEQPGVGERAAESSPAATETVAAAAARRHSPFPSPPSRRAPGTARPQQPHTRSATSSPAPLRGPAGAPEVTSARAPPPPPAGWSPSMLGFSGDRSISAVA